MICPLYPEPVYLIFSEEVPSLLYYAHIPVTVLALLVGFFVLANNWRNAKNRLLLVICLSFAGWAAANLVLWTAIDSSILLLTWPFLAIFSSFISIFSVYFTYAFLNDGKDVSFLTKLLFMLLLAPLLLFAHTNLNISGFDISDCDAFNYEGVAYKTYQMLLSLVALIWIITLLGIRYRTASRSFRQQILLLGGGLLSFLSLFFSFVYLASHFATIGIFQDSRLELFGLSGMALFLVAISILVVKFKAFHTQLITAQALTVTLVVLVFSLLFVDDPVVAERVIFLTLAFLLGVGVLLVRNVKQEVAAKERNEALARDLARVNNRLRDLDRQKSEFVSIASHQLRSPLTAIRGYASMILEGSFGKLPTKAQEAIERIHESSGFMALSIEDFLNVSRIEQGRMKYEFTDMDLKSMVEKIVDEIRPSAIKKGLVLMFKSQCEGTCVVHVDPGKMRQIIYNLIDNSLKYTQKGTVTVTVSDNVKGKRLYVEIRDTGVGMSLETLHNIFDKFVRAKNANSVNVSGTGLGLYVAKQMIEAMGGKVTPASEGEGKGSAFTIELPLT